MADGLDELGHEVASAGAVRVPVGGDHSLVDAPGRLDVDVLLDPVQRGESMALAVGEEVRAGVQGPTGTVERVVNPAAVPVQVLLDPAPAAVQRVTGEANDMERIHHRDRVGQLLPAARGPRRWRS